MGACPIVQGIARTTSPDQKSLHQFGYQFLYTRSLLLLYGIQRPGIPSSQQYPSRNYGFPPGIGPTRFWTGHPVVVRWPPDSATIGPGSRKPGSDVVFFKCSSWVGLGGLLSARGRISSD